jgi:magnesium transporter
VTHVRGRVWRAGKPQDDFDFPSISDYLVQDDTLVWCDIYDPDHAILKDLAQELSLNTWAVEDAIAEAERTKAVVYRSHTFFTVYGVSTKEPSDETESMLDVHRISGFVLPRGLITVRLSPHFDIDAVSQRFDELGGQEYGVGALVHGLLDVVVDGHFEAVQALDENNPRKGLQRKTFRLRKDLVELRRVVLPMREVVSSIQHRRLDAKTAPELDPLYSDLYDHVLRVSEWTESLRDMVTTVFETNLSLQDARLNTVMKKLTGWAAIIAVPTAITGFYGQNVK